MYISDDEDLYSIGDSIVAQKLEFVLVSRYSRRQNKLHTRSTYYLLYRLTNKHGISFIPFSASFIVPELLLIVLLERICVVMT